MISWFLGKSQRKEPKESCDFQKIGQETLNFMKMSRMLFTNKSSNACNEVGEEYTIKWVFVL